MQSNEIIKLYVIKLIKLLESFGANAYQIKVVTEDISNRLSILNRWNDLNFRKNILLPSIEEAIFYKPQGSAIDVKCLVNLCIRNSKLEEMHTNYPDDNNLLFNLSENQIKSITSEAIKYFSEQDLTDLPLEGITIYDHFISQYPKTWELFSTIRTLKNKQKHKKFSPSLEKNEIKINFKNIFGATEKSVVMSGISSEFCENEQKILHLISQGKVPYFYSDSFKMVTRNIDKLFKILEFTINHGTPFVTSNFVLNFGEVCVREPFIKPAHTVAESELKVSNLQGTSTVHKNYLFERKKMLAMEQ